MEYRQEPEDYTGEVLGTSDKRELAPRVQGITAGDYNFDIKRIVADLEDEYSRLLELKKRGNNQKIIFDQSVVCMTFIADAHIGHPGVNIRRLIDDIQLIVDTPGMWLFTVGDLVENMIMPKLMNNRLVSNELDIPREWALLKHIIDLMNPKLVGACGGNHEAWTTTLSGQPYFVDTIKSVKPAVLYDNDDISFDIVVGGAAFQTRARHKWRGYSKWNPTHGMEDMQRFESAYKLLIGAHTHVSGLVREFNQNMHTRLALLCGSYKDIDPYARKIGVPRANDSAAVSVLLFDDGTMLGISNLKRAAELMRMYRA